MRRRCFEPWEWHSSEIAAPLERIAKLSTKLQAALSEIDENNGRIACGVHDYLDHELRMNSAQRLNIDYIHLHSKHALELHKAATSAAVNARRDMKTKGAPRGIRGHPRLAHFITLLVNRVSRAGGTITINRAETGSLIDMLEELRPSRASIDPSRHQHRRRSPLPS